MTQQQMDRLTEAGIQVETALGRFMGNEALFLKFLLRFPADPSYSQLREALQQEDLQQAFTAAHTLKGTAGNLSLEELYHPVSLAVEDLRAGNLAAAKERLPQMEKAYQAILACLENWQ